MSVGRWRLRRTAAALALVVPALQAAGQVAAPAASGPPAGGSAFAFPEFGPPVVLVEAERPEHPDDRRIGALVAEALAVRGIRCADGEEARGRSRAVADRAFDAGAPAHAARSAVDRPGVDFVARIGVSAKDAGSTRAYGIEIAARECSVRIALVRASDQSVLEVAPASASARASSAAIAARDAEASAVDLAAAAVEAATAADWLAVSEGRRPWIVELVAPSASDVERALGAMGSGVVLLDNRPGVRTLLQASKADVDALAASSGGSMVVMRPGHAVLSSASAPDRASPWPWIAAMLGASGAAAAAILVRRMRRATLG